MARHDLMFSLGIYPLHFSPRQLRQEQPSVIKRIQDTYGRGLERSPLPIRTVPLPGLPGLPGLPAK